MQFLKADYLIDVTDGTYKREYSCHIIPSLGTKYITFEILSNPNPDRASFYLLDYAGLEEIVPRINKRTRSKYCKTYCHPQQNVIRKV
jgi:hypothetical protein